MKALQRRTPSRARRAAFTLIELMVVVIVLGILAAAAIPNFMRMRRNAERGSCLSNQRNILQGATLYINDSGTAAGVINVGALGPLGYVSMRCSECPRSNVADHDDYTITIAGQRVTDIRCDVQSAEHDWNGMN